MNQFALFVGSSLFALASCSDGTSNSSSIQDLAYNSESAKNIALFFTAPRPRNNSQVYIDNDPEVLIEGIFALDQNFSTFKDEAATASSVTSTIATKVAPDSLSDDGTLFVYIGGHGAPSAQAQMSDGSFVGWETLANAVKLGRPNKPLKRLVLMVFGCYSGSWINRLSALETSSVADEIFIMTSSAANQLSYSGGVNSHFVRAFHKVMDAYLKNPSDVSLQKFSLDIARNMQSSTPQHWSRPDSVKNETLFSQIALAEVHAAIEDGISLNAR